jgi:PAS domain S-box-containing protein
MKAEVLDLIDFEKVDILLEGFNKTTGFVTAILDLDGNVISKSGWRQLCTEFHRMNPETSKRCTYSDTVLAGKLAMGEKYHFYKCMNGLVDVAVPIIIKGEHIANLFSGQFFFEEPDISFFIKQAKTFGFAEEKYMEALSQVPVVSMEKVQVAMEFLLNMTQLISEMTLQKIELMVLNNTLRESEQKLNEARKLAQLGHWSWDIKTGEVEWSEEVYRIFQLDPDKFKPRIDLIMALSPWPGDAERDQELIRRAIESHEKGNYEQRFLRTNGTIGYYLSTFQGNYDAGGNLTSIVGTVQDITDRKVSEAALQESKTRYRSILRVAPVGIVIHQDGKIVFANPASVKIIGASSINQIIGRDINSIIHPDNLEAALQRINRLVSGEQGLYPVEDRYLRFDGNIIDVEVIATFLTYNEKPAIQVIISDITERKRIREALSQLNSNLESKVMQRTAELEASNRELEAFSYSVSHDLRAPLRHINGYVDLLIERYQAELPEKARHYLANVSDSAKQMGTLIDDLLKFSRTSRQEMRKKGLDMNSVVNEVLKKLNPDFEKRTISLKVQQLPAVYGDYALLKQVWFNLIDNAIKYTRNKKIAEINISYTEEQENIIFSISDNGVGFDMKYSQKLFGVFQRLHTHSEFEGTGIGLANVQRIVLKHNGRIWAEAEPDKGATFYFSLPKKTMEN